MEKGAVTPAYQGNMNETIEILQAVLATEIVCALRCTMNAVAATGISSDCVKKEFDQYAKEEQQHMRSVAERIACEHYGELIRYFGDKDPWLLSLNALPPHTPPPGAICYS